jgi:hypothetical protein
MQEWRTAVSHCGGTAIVETLDQLDTWWGAHDSTAISQEVWWWFHDPVYWPNAYVLLIGGWTSQPEFAQYREVQTRYVSVPFEIDGAEFKAATDQPFGDVNFDGVWEVPVWRFVPLTDMQNSVQCAKVCAYSDLRAGQIESWMRSIAIDCDDTEYGGGAAPYLARQLCQAARNTVPDGAFAADPVALASEHPADYNRSVLYNQLCAGKAVIIAGPSTLSWPGHWLCFTPLSDWHFDSGPANGRWPLMVGACCDLNPYDRYWSDDDGSCPVARDWIHVDSPMKGPIGWIGPSRGTYQWANAYILERLIPLLCQGFSFGQALCMATGSVQREHPGIGYMIRTYNGLGAPWLRLPAAPEPPDLAGARAGPAGLDLVIRPNPVTGREAVISMRGPAGIRSGALIVGTNGRVIRTLAPGAEVRWDTRDGSGHMVPSGVYFVVPEEHGVSPRALIVVR